MGNTVLEPLATAIDDLLALDADTLTDAERHEVVVGLQLQCTRLAAVNARLISRWDSSQIWADDGSRSAGARLAREAKLSNATAHAQLRQARQLRTMPHTAKALAEGTISADHVGLLGKANKPWRNARFDEHEASLVEHCQRLRFNHARRAVQYWCQHADAEAAEQDGQELADQATFSAATTIDGTVHVSGMLDPVGGEIFQESLQRIEHELYLVDKRTGVTRTVGQRRAAALVEMAIRAHAAPKSGLRPRPLVTILCGELTLARVCELAAGVVVAPGQIVPLLSDADIERIVFDGPDRVIGVSRRRRFTGALRRAIEVRDRHCMHPSGCDVPASRCDVDHIQPYTAGGVTSQDDGRLECDVHNRDAKKHDLRPKDPSGSQVPLQHPAEGQSPGDDPSADHPDQRPPPERE